MIDGVSVQGVNSQMAGGGHKCPDTAHNIQRDKATFRFKI